MAGIAFDQVSLVAHKVEETLAFYRFLGLEIPDSAIWSTPSGKHHITLSGAQPVSLDLDSRKLAERYNVGYSAERAHVTIGFRLETREAVDALYERAIGAGHQGLQRPFDAFWGARYAIIEDPDGNPVGLMSPADDAHRAAPPDL